jgi:hypothetical protein
MMLRYGHLSRYPQVFQTMTGLRLAEFDTLLEDMLPRYAASERARLQRPARRRKMGGGHPFELDARDQLLLSVIWLRQYPVQVVLGYLFGVSPSTVGRLLTRWLPLLAASGRDTMRRPDPGRKRRRSLEALVLAVPELAVIVDSFEQRVQRPRTPKVANTYYSGKKKLHTLKSQVAVSTSGHIVDVAPSVAGPTADITVLKASGLLARLPPERVVGGDLAYVGMDKERAEGVAATPRRKPRGQPRPTEDVLYNRAFAQERIVVEHTIGRLRRYQALTQMDRHHRQQHTARVCAVAGLVNRQLDRRYFA